MNLYSIQQANGEFTYPRLKRNRPENPNQQVNEEMTHPIFRNFRQNQPIQQVNEEKTPHTQKC